MVGFGKLPGATRRIANIMSEQTTRMTNSAITMPLQFRSEPLDPTSSCAQKNNKKLRHFRCKHIQ